MRVAVFLLVVAVAMLGGLAHSTSVSQAVYPDDPIVLGTLSDQFGVGCPAETTPPGFSFSYGLFEDAPGQPLALVFDSVVIESSADFQTFIVDETSDPEFAAVAQALRDGPLAGATFGYQVEMGCLSTSVGPGLAIPLDLVGLPVRGLRLTIPPVSIVEMPQGTFTIVPSGNFTLSAIGSSADLADTDGDGTPDVSDGCPNEAGPPVTDGCPDGDGDGTPDAGDACPTDAGPPDFDGCPDSDNDGVPDHRDLCQGQQGPLEWDGCPDTDQDGLPDHQDACPTEGGPLELDGCPADTDGDGVADPGDACPSVPGLPQFDGCPDDDGDGVPEPGDACPGQAGLPEFAGCPDSDLDGTPDPADVCPFDAGPPNTSGCPDDDGDGVADQDDLCRGVPGSPGADGCPDFDTDGIGDPFDACPIEPGPPATDGCPDQDADGVIDRNDVCIFEAGLPQYLGCQRADMDGDGVPQGPDACPFVSSGGYDADDNGCKDTLSGLLSLIAASSLPANTSRSLTNKVEDARHLACDIGNVTGAIQKLEDFRSYVAAQTPSRIPASTAMLLDAYAATLIRELQDGAISC